MVVEECSENTDGNKMIYNGTLNYHKSLCNSYTIYMALLVIASLTIMSISSVFIIFHWHLIYIHILYIYIIYIYIYIYMFILKLNFIII